MLLRQKRDNKFVIILFISIIFHIVFFTLANFKLKNQSFEVVENKIEIDLNNYTSSEYQQDQFIPNFQKIPKIVKTNLTNKSYNIKRVIKISSKNIEPIDITQLNMIPSDIPMEYKLSKKNAPLNKSISNGKKKSSINTSKIISKYLFLIKEKIKKNTIYPLIARKRGIEGKTIVEFTILKNGKIKNFKIIKSSGFSILDKAAEKSIQKSIPFPSIPKKLNKTSLKIRIPIEFALE